MNALIVHAPNQMHDIIDFIGMSHNVVTHATPGCEIHFLVLQVKRRVREQRTIAGVVVMHVSDDHVLHSFRIDSERAHTFFHRAYDRAFTLVGGFLAETGVHDDSARLVRNGPDVII